MIASGMLLSYVADYLLKGLPETMALARDVRTRCCPCTDFIFRRFSSTRVTAFSSVQSGRLEEAKRVLNYIRHQTKLNRNLNKSS